MVDSILANGLRGVKIGLESAARNAESLSTAFQENGSGDPLTPAIGLTLDRMQIKASLSVIKTAEEIEKSVLDILA